MSIDIKIISQLRDQTGAGIGDCKAALEETAGDLTKAIEVLRKKGEIKAAKKSAERVTKEGLVEAYIHSSNKVGALVGVACETDFVAKTEDFKGLVKAIAMQVAAMAPLYLAPETVPAEVVAKEKEIYSEQLKQEGKPEAIWEKVIAGKLAKYYEEVCLLNQLYIKDDSKKISDLINELIAKTGEKIEVKDFIRYQI